jgi:hypothetical protein
MTTSSGHTSAIRVSKVSAPKYRIRRVRRSGRHPRARTAPLRRDRSPSPPRWAHVAFDTYGRPPFALNR